MMGIRTVTSTKALPLPATAAIGLAALLACGSFVPQCMAKEPLAVKHTQNTDTIPLYETFELTFRHENDYKNPFFDVTIEVVFTSPSNRQLKVGGFHYGSSSDTRIRKHTVKTERGERLDVTYELGEPDLWKARFAPSQTGKWRYEFTFANVRGENAAGHGSFLCVRGRKPNRGFVRLHPKNPFRFVFDDESAYFPIGLQDCWGDGSGTGSLLDQCSMEGPFRTDLKDLPALPPGPMFVRGPANNPQNADVYFRAFSQCGFNLYRFSQQNCSFALNQDLERYLVQEAIMTDELLRCARKYDMRIMYGIFGFQKVFNDAAHNEEGMAKVKRFIKYSVDRWGAHVDFWEFLNEQTADTQWYEIVIPYLKSIDPYHHPITTSWERPELEGIDISAPHWYQREHELTSDAVTASRAKDYRRFGKPVIIGEQGNHVDRKTAPPGVGGVWDERSHVRMRLRNWTALFNEIAVVFWNTSYARDGHYMNIWLGPKEREYVRAMQDFAYRLDKEVRMVPVTVSLPRDVRAYALASNKRAGVYLHHFRSHTAAVTGLKVTLNIPADTKGYWYSPENADILGTVDVAAGQRTLDVPEFKIDMALLLTPDGPPDIDKDGRPNNVDDDDDEDGTPDNKDAFPLDAQECLDRDMDLIGDNMDADDDGDGIGDDRNGNGVPDFEEKDFDGDGIDRSGAIPWDAFPWDGAEWRDSDGDGIGDNADADDDNDGWTDEQEKRQKTDPLDKTDFPTSTANR